MTTEENVRTMASVTNPTTLHPDVGLDQAVRAAEAAAATARTTVREITDLAELEQVVRLYGAIWGRTGNPPMTLELLRALTKAGNYVAGAFDGTRLVGACVGFFHAPSEDALHSHIAGVSAQASGRSVGFALKLHQRAWAMDRGISEVLWTFDPLVARNAYFNVTKLAAEPVEYLLNFYGSMFDTINGVDDSDRLLVRWRLQDAAVVTACGGSAAAASFEDEVAAGAQIALGVSASGAPVPGRLDAVTSLVAVPRAIESLRVRDGGLAQRWRRAVRDVMAVLMADGAHIDGFDRSGWYVVRRTR